MNLSEPTKVSIYDDLVREGRLPFNRPLDADLKNLAGILETVSSVCEIDSLAILKIEKMLPVNSTLRHEIKRVREVRAMIEEEEKDEMTIWQGCMARNYQKIIYVRAEFGKQFLDVPGFFYEHCLALLEEGFLAEPEAGPEVPKDEGIINIQSQVKLTDFSEKEKIAAFFLFPAIHRKNAENTEKTIDDCRKAFLYYFKACEQRAIGEAPKILVSRLGGQYKGLGAFIVPPRVGFAQELLADHGIQQPKEDLCLLLLIYRMTNKLPGGVPQKVDSPQEDQPTPLEANTREICEESEFEDGIVYFSEFNDEDVLNFIMEDD